MMAEPQLNTVYDPTTGEYRYGGRRVPAPASLKYSDPRGTEDDPFAKFNAGDIARENQAGTRDAIVAGGIGALGSLAQIGTTLVDTATDRYNKDRIAKLTKHKGLSQGERADIDERANRQVKALSTANQSRTEDALAASGGHSAADLSRVQRVNTDATNRAAINAADIGIQANLEQVRADTRELEEQLSYKSERARQRLDYAAQAIAGIGKVVAPVLASSPSTRAPTDAEFLSMQNATNPDGSMRYPGYQGKSTEDMRRLWTAEVRANQSASGLSRP